MRTDSSDRLSPEAGYRLWAPTYEKETALSALEERMVQKLLPEIAGRRLLDVGCGVGRRVRGVSDRLALAVGVDLVPEMLRAGGGRDPGRVAGDVRMLPFASECFDLLWCRLVLGHVDDLEASYREMARVSRHPAQLIVSDFHPSAVAAGHTRSFRDSAGHVHEIEHVVHRAEEHATAAGLSGWTLAARMDAAAGDAERPFYERAGRLEQLDAERDLPLVLIMSFQR